MTHNSASLAAVAALNSLVHNYSTQFWYLCEFNFLHPYWIVSTWKNTHIPKYMHMHYMHVYLYGIETHV